MNAIQLLEADHKRVKGLFEDFRSAGKRAQKKKEGIVDRALQELQVHTTLEEEIFYPALRARGGELEKLIAESLEEHHVVKVLMEEIRGLEPDDEAYEAKFTVLMENVEHHVEEEEGKLFPMVEDALAAKDGKKDEMMALGEQMAARKDELQTARSR